MALRFDEKGKFYTEYISKVSVLVTLQTATHQIKGYIHVRKDQRLSDELNKPDPFLPITDATVFTPDGKVFSTSKFLAVNRAHIIWLLPEEEDSDIESSAGGT